jgi:hypothetical protein
VKRYLSLASSYVGLVILANWLASRYVVSVGFGAAVGRPTPALATHAA